MAGYALAETGMGMAHEVFEYLGWQTSMSPDKIALLFYIAGSLCFLGGSLVMWFK